MNLWNLHFRMLQLVLVAVGLLAAQCTGQQQKQEESTKAAEEVPPAVYTFKDSLIFEKIITQAEANQWAAQPAGKTVASVAKQFMGRPYTAKTLEVATPEKLVANLHEFDCTTLMENSMALARTIHQDYASFNQYLRNLEDLRYRNGQLDGYLSRLHYTSDWLYNNAQLGFIKLVTDRFEGTEKINFPVRFMSEHPDLYKQLQGDSQRVQAISEQEERIRRRDYYVLPQEKLEANFNKFKPGDMVGFVTSKEGLDIAHVGLICLREGNPHVMHASMSADKVVTSEKTLAGYVNGISHMTGVVVARLQIN